MAGKIVIEKAKNEQPFFKIVHDNGNILNHSETYSANDKCQHGLEAHIDIILDPTTEITGEGIDKDLLSKKLDAYNRKLMLKFVEYFNVHLIDPDTWPLTSEEIDKFLSNE